MCSDFQLGVCFFMLVMCLKYFFVILSRWPCMMPAQCGKSMSWMLSAACCLILMCREISWWLVECPRGVWLTVIVVCVFKEIFFSALKKKKIIFKITTINCTSKKHYFFSELPVCPELLNLNGSLLDFKVLIVLCFWQCILNFWICCCQTLYSGS